MGIFLSVFTLLRLVPALLADTSPPTLLVESRSNASVTIAITGSDDVMNKCARGGLELRYQFQIEMCHERSLWFDSCKRTWSEKNSIQYDSVSQSFRINRDRLGDGKSPLVLYADTMGNAMKIASQSDPFDLLSLANMNQAYLDDSRTYVQLRAITYCREDDNRTFERIAGFVTTGVTGLVQFDSKWQPFSILRNSSGGVTTGSAKVAKPERNTPNSSTRESTSID